MTRKLIFHPVIHPNDEVSHKIKIYRLPIHAKEYSIPDSDEFWKNLDERLEIRLKELNFDYRKIRVYQDAMDEIPTEEQLSSGAKVSKNWKLTLKLYKKGAIIMRTESKQLVDEHERLLKNTLSRMEEIIDNVDKRDRYIAKNIGKTLKEDELGILFVGVGHDVLRFLPPDIDIEYGFLTKETYEEWQKEIQMILKDITKKENFGREDN